MGIYRSLRRSAVSMIGRILLLLAVVAAVTLATLTAAPERGVAQTNPVPVQSFYVPFPEDQLLQGLQAIEFGGPGNAPADPVTTYISIAAIADGTIVYYDQWENGYDADIANPGNMYSAGNPGGTQVWGDGDTANGAPPGVPSDIIQAGTVIVLNNQLYTTNLSAIDFDGRDKIAATKNVAVTRTGWASGSGTLLAGAVEVYDTSNWGTEYRAPVGEDIPDGTDHQMFSYTGLAIMAGPGGATISVDANADGDFADAGDLDEVTIAEGVSRFVNGGVNVGALVESNNPVQVDILTGDRGSNYESRDSALLPVAYWSSSYYTPVSTVSTYGTTVWLYNPGASSITVTYERRDAGGALTTSAISVPAGGYATQALPANTPAHFYTGGDAFYAFSTTDSTSSNYSNNQSYDWGFSLVPLDSLTPQVLVGLGIGKDPTIASAENGNPLWLTPIGNGNTDVRVYIDYDADPGTGDLTDPNGNGYDAWVDLRELEQAKIFDPDGNQTGMLAYVLEPGVKLAAAWGQDPLAASAGTPGLDVGTSVPPCPLFSAGKNGTLYADNDGDGFITEGDELEYTIVINNISRAPVPDVILRDNLPAETTYVPGSTYNQTAGSPIPDDGSGTAFPLDGSGVNVGTIPVRGSITVTLRVIINDPVSPGTVEILNSGSATAVGIEVPFEDVTPLGGIGDFVWHDANANGIQDAGEAGIEGVIVNLYAADGTTLIATATTDADGYYAFTGLDSGSYIVEFVKPAGYDASPQDQGADDALDSDADATTGRTAAISWTAGETNTTIDAGFFVPTPGIAIMKVTNGSDGLTIPAGENVIWTYAVTNTGNVPLSDVGVTDNVSGVVPATVLGADTVHNIGDTDNDGLLDLSENWTFEATGTAVAGQYDNLGTATGTPPAGEPVTASDPSSYFGSAPGIHLEKAVDPAIFSAPGTATFTYVVTNIGNVSLTSVVVTDDNATPGDASDDFQAVYTGGDTDEDGQLDLDETWTFTATRAITQADIDAGAAITNWATASSTEAASEPDDATITFSQNPAIAIEKTVDPAIFSAPGTATFTYVVTNIGNVSLTNVIVTDDNATPGDASDDFQAAYTGGDTDEDGQLDLDETWTFTATRAITQADIDAGAAITNWATASSTEAASEPDDATITFSQNPAIAIEKTVDPAIFSAPGTATFTYVVTNLGNVSLTNVIVTDDNASPGDASDDFQAAYTGGDTDEDGQLDLDETWTFTATRAITQADIDAGAAITNWAMASSAEAASEPADATITFGQAPALNILKDLLPAGQVADVAGENITYAITVTNIGNVTLTGVAVSDAFATGGLVRNPDAVGDNDDLLEVGEVWSYTAGHIVTQAEIDAGVTLVNTATADSDQTGPDSDDASVPVAQDPALDIVKTLNPAGQVADVAGESITYLITVQNSGNRTLTGVTVSDPFATGGIVRNADIAGDGDDLLEVGEVWSYTATHIVTQAEIDSNGDGDGFLENTATAGSDQTGPDTDDATVPLTQNAALDIVKALDPAGQVADVAGESITYLITVQNSGNQSLTGVTVSDPFATGGIVRNADITGDGDDLLEVGEVWSYTATHIVTQGEIDAGEDLVNVATADSDQTGPDTDDATVPVSAYPALDIVKALDPGDQVADVAGESITYLITVQNSGNRTLTGVTVSDPFATGGIVRNADIAGDGDDLLEVGEVWSYTATHIVTQAEIDGNGGGDGFLENTATAGSDQTGPDTDDATVPVGQNPALDVVKALNPADQVADVAGESITYLITVQNSGNQSLTGVTVSDPFATGGIVRNADIAGDGDDLLEVGEVWSYTATHFVTQAEIDGNGGGNGLLENTATADSDQTGPDSDDATVPVYQNAALDVVKALDPAGQVADVAGESITYLITVQNSGNQSLTGVTVSDPFATGGIERNADITGDNDNLLEVGEVWSYTATHIVTQSEIDGNGGGNGLLENTATADSDQTGPDSDDATVPVTQNPALDIVKSVFPADQVADLAGESITYLITVQNSGNRTLTGVTVSDPFATGGIVRNADITGDGDDLLEVGETWSYTATHILTQAEIDAGEDLVNTATADSNETGPDTDDANLPLDQNPELDIVKSLDPVGQVADVAGEEITYHITVQNSGNQSLTGVTVSDPFATGGIERNADITGDDDNDLEVGEVWSYTATHFVTQAEIDGNGGDGFLENTATADSDQTGPDSDDASVPVAQNPALDIVKALDPADQAADVAGEEITYHITVQNSGNQSLTGVTVTDPFATGGIERNADMTGDDDNDLEVGEVWSYTATHIVTQAEIDSNGGGDGLLENTATADSDQTGPDSDDATVPVAQNPALDIVKALDPADQAADVAGESITYLITVQNSGNRTLTGVTVSDPFATGGIVRNADITGDNDDLLEVGEKWSYSATHLLTQGEIDAGEDLVNVATADSDQTGPDSDDATVPVYQNPALDIVKALDPADQVADLAGESITYLITVQNSGNRTLTGVTVSDPFATGGIVRNADITGDNDDLLEVGEKWSYTATHILTQGEIDAGDDLVNVATADSDQTGPDSDDAMVPVDQNPALDIVKALDPADQAADVAGEEITYHITVQNSGNQSLTGVTVSDPFATGGIVRNADITGDNDDLLEVGEKWSYTASHILTQAEIDGGDDLVNVATADSDQTGPDSDDATVPVAQNPALDVVKALNPVDQVADVAGESITYLITVQNSGNRSLTGVTVTDPFATGGIVRNADITGDNDNLLEVGEKWSYTATHILTQGEIDAGEDLVNVATADSDQTGPDTDDATVPVAEIPLVSIDKTVTAVDAAGNGSIDHPDEIIAYQVVVTNTGNVALTGTLSDSLAGISAISGPVESIATDGILAVGETWTYTYTYAVTAADIAGHGGCDGDIDNTATFTPSAGTPQSDSEEVPITEDILPDISVEKTASVCSVPASGANVDFTFVVTNHSDEQVTLTSLLDSVFGELLSGPVTIAPHDSYTLTITRWVACGTTSLKMGGLVVSCCPVPACRYHYNKVTATAYDDQGNQDTATDDAKVTFTPAAKPDISVTKTASVCSVPASGANVDFTFVVTNKGSQEVTLTSLLDSVFGELLSGPVTIAAHDTYTLTITRWIACGSTSLELGGLSVSCCPVPACRYHYNKVTATAYDDQGNKDTATDDAKVTFTPVAKPDISVTKTASARSVPASGANVDFTFVVTNKGSQAVTLTSLRDSVFGELLSGPVTIAAHDRYTLTITRWIACGSAKLKVGGLAVSCHPVPACRYHYNKVTAVARDAAGRKDTATDDARVMYTSVRAAVEDDSLNAQTAADPQAAVDPQGDGAGATAQPDAVAPVTGNGGPTHEERASAVGDSETDSAAKGFPYYLLALPAILVLAAAGLLIRRRVRTAGTARSAGDKQD